MSDFKEVTQIEDPDGVGLVASITARNRASGYRTFSFSIYKQYTDKNGEVRRTNYLNERHINAAIKLLHAVSERIALEQEKLDTQRRRKATP